MKKAICLTLICIFYLVQIYGQRETPDQWREPRIPTYQLPDSLKSLSFIRVEGNHFVDENGNTIVFKGLSIADPDKIKRDGHWERRHFEVIKSWGANLVRIPVHPAGIRQQGMVNYIKLLDEAVTWCSELGMYVIIDWHSIGNLHMEMFQNRMYDTTKKETYNFWKIIANHYKDIPTVAFYEIFNEPTVFNGTLGNCSWEEWKQIVENIIDIIYGHDKNVIPLVGGFDWAYDLRPVEFQPIERQGIAYVTHPYPGKCQLPREPNWEATFGFLANRYPIIATELGYMLEGHEEHLIEDGTYRDAIVNYLEQKGISWCAWVFDPNWSPQMIENWNYDPTHQGAFFRDVMQGKYQYKK